MKALLIIDMQNDFMPGGSLEVGRGDEIVPVINSLNNQFGLIIATQDWHPPNHVSFASNHPNKNPFDIITIQGIKQTLWPDHCVQGTFGAEFHPDLVTDPIEAIFRKGTDTQIDSYSGFFDNQHKKRTGLLGYLREKGISDLYFCGLASDICVYYSIKDAVQEGFNCYLIEDATRPLDNDQFSKIKNELRDLNVTLIQSSAILID